MELEIKRSFIIAFVAAVVIVSLIALGWASSPWVHGRPVLLSPANYAIRKYLDRADGWARESRKQAEALQDLSTVQGSTPSDIYRAGERIQGIQDSLGRVYARMDAAEVPPAMKGLHELGVSAVELEISWSKAVGAQIGAPSPEGEAAVQSARARAMKALATWWDTVKEQRGETGG